MRSVRCNLNNPDVLRDVAVTWRGDLPSLRGIGIAHNDLQHGNVMVQADGRIRLVDYDGIFLPGLSPPDEKGHSNYQHPLRRTAEDYDGLRGQLPCAGHLP